jgi:hypothetical protein
VQGTVTLGAQVAVSPVEQHLFVPDSTLAISLASTERFLLQTLPFLLDFFNHPLRERPFQVPSQEDGKSRRRLVGQVSPIVLSCLGLSRLASPTVGWSWGIAQTDSSQNHYRTSGFPA